MIQEDLELEVDELIKLKEKNRAFAPLVNNIEAMGRAVFEANRQMEKADAEFVKAMKLDRELLVV